MRNLSGFILDHQSPPQNPQGSFDLADMGAMVGVQQLADCRFAEVQPLGEGNLGYPIAAHGGIERQFSRRHRGHWHQMRARRGGARERNSPFIVNIARQRNGQGIGSQFQRFGLAASAGQGFGHIGKLREKTPVRLGRQKARVSVAHLEFLLGDFQLLEHRSQQAGADFPLLHGGKARTDIKSPVAAFAVVRGKAGRESCLLSPALGAADEFTAINLFKIALKGANFNRKIAA
jgi:hypothetical protein